MNNLKATKREGTSSGSNNKLRADGLIPAILYGGTNPNQNISIEPYSVQTQKNMQILLGLMELKYYFYDPKIYQKIAPLI